MGLKFGGEEVGARSDAFRRIWRLFELYADDQPVTGDGRLFLSQIAAHDPACCEAMEKLGKHYFVFRSARNGMRGVFITFKDGEAVELDFRRAIASALKR